MCNTLNRCHYRWTTMNGAQCIRCLSTRFLSNYFRAFALSFFSISLLPFHDVAALYFARKFLFKFHWAKHYAKDSPVFPDAQIHIDLETCMDVLSSCCACIKQFRSARVLYCLHMWMCWNKLPRCHLTISQCRHHMSFKILVSH